MLIVPIASKSDSKHLPYCCIALILINCFILFFLQSGDNAIYRQAQQYYGDSGLLEIELKAYHQYLLDKGTNDVPSLSSEKGKKKLSNRMFSDREFMDRLEQGLVITRNSKEYREWSGKRKAYKEILGKAFISRFGYSPRENSLLTMFTCTYLHGGVMHLVGNMVFLWLVGAILEVAVGAIPFIVLYTVTGICASALYGFIYPASSGPLVGASGAIAGLMGAYGVIFGLRKITVFYSFGFYFDYARLPALVLFPVWVANEFLQLYTNVGSNVAYVAHIGGLLSGVVIGLGYRQWRKERIEGLFAGEEKNNELEATIEKAMSYLAELDLVQARNAFEKVLQLDPVNTQAIKQIYHIEKSFPSSDALHSSAHRLLDHLLRTNPQDYLLVFNEYRKTAEKPKVTTQMLEHVSHLSLAGQDYKNGSAYIAALLKRDPENVKLPALLANLAKGYQKSQQPDRAMLCMKILAAKFPATPEGIAAAQFFEKKKSVSVGS